MVSEYLQMSVQIFFEKEHLGADKLLSQWFIGRMMSRSAGSSQAGQLLKFTLYAEAVLQVG